MAKNELKPMVAAAFGEKPSRYPVWFLRQAGRYLPEYRAVRQDLSFVELCKNPAKAAEVTIQPLKRYDLDAAIIFSDILIPCTGMGQVLTFDKGHGPELNAPVRSAADLAKLRVPHAEKDLGFVGEAIQHTIKQLQPHQAMIGFAGAPFTVATYMIEGCGSRDHTEVKKLLFRDQKTFTDLLDLLAEVTTGYLKMQIDAGADVVMLFDTWAGQLSADDYRAHVYPATAKLLKAVRSFGKPVIYYPGQGLDKTFELQGMSFDVLAVDWRTRLRNAAATLKSQNLNVTLQGNLDPQVLIAPEEVVRERTRAIITEAKECTRAHIFNVGHGLLPHIPPESLTWVIDEVRQAKI